MVVGGCRWFWVVPCFSTYPLSEPGRSENPFKSGTFSKRYGFIGRVNGDLEFARLELNHLSIP